jgi:hypothetical protein
MRRARLLALEVNAAAGATLGSCLAILLVTATQIFQAGDPACSSCGCVPAYRDLSCDRPTYDASIARLAASGATRSAGLPRRGPRLLAAERHAVRGRRGRGAAK